MEKYRFGLNLQLFSDEVGAETGVEDVPAAEVQEESQTGVEDQAVAEPGNNFEKAFAKRLAQERAKWESEVNSKYKDYDTHKQLSEYFQRINGMDAQALRERVELEMLQEQAEKQNVPVEVMQRLLELEAKAAQADQFAKQQQQAEFERNYWSSLNDYAKELDVKPEEINQFLVENGLYVNPEDLKRSFDLAYKAIRYEKMQKELETAQKDGMLKLLQAKGSIPTVPGGTSQGQVVTAAPKTFAEARARAMQRMSQSD